MSVYLARGVKRVYRVRSLNITRTLTDTKKKKKNMITYLFLSISKLKTSSKKNICNNNIIDT